jgi:NitT/TauT family transport system substrate-binding protein
LNRSQALGLTSTALAAATLRLPPAAAQNAKVRFGCGIGDNFGEPLFANDGGFFARYGIDADILTLGSGGALTAALAGGALDVTISNIASIAQAHFRGLPISLIAGSSIYSADAPPTTVVLVLNDSPVRAAKDLIGKTLAMTTLHDTEQAAVMAWFDKNGVNPLLVNYVEARLPDQLPALKAHRVDATLTSDPWSTAALQDGARILCKPYDVLARRLQTTAWVARNDWLDTNKALAQRLVAAIHDTAVWANHNRPATAVILQKYSKMTDDTMAKLHRMEFAEHLDPALIQPIIDASARYGFLPQRFPASNLFAAFLQS